jgi:NAD(P)-dependent dehydrogenase (short-subunit alcohol dehydrogenase family)
VNPSLDGKVAVVLGASAEGGSGWAIARTFAQAGAQVVVGARRLDRLQELAARIGALAVRCDAGEENEVAALAARALDHHGKLDVAVNCAGQLRTGTVDEATCAQLLEALHSDYLPNVYFVKHMARAIDSDGSIVLMSSMSSTHPVPLAFPYACAKAATDCLVRYAAIEYGPQRIRVNSILPCLIRSDMAGPALAAPGLEQVYAREVPLGRIGEPSDVADAALWLAGTAFVTGLNLQVNGGNQLRRYPYPEEVSASIAGVLTENY